MSSSAGTSNSSPASLKYFSYVCLALGAWGAVQATAAGAAVALGGIGRDAVQALADRGTLGPTLSAPATGYVAIYLLEAGLLVGTVAVMRLLRQDRARSDLPPAAERTPPIDICRSH